MRIAFTKGIMLFPPIALLSMTAIVSSGQKDAEGIAFFERKVRPLLITNCLSCHSAQSKPLMGGLLLDSKAGTLKGGDHGPAIVPGQPEKSLLIQALHYDGKVKMPPKGKLSDADIALLTEWVQRGAPDPRESKATPPAKRAIDLAKESKHWAYQPLQRGKREEGRGKRTPNTQYLNSPIKNQKSKIKNPVDAFIHAKLRQNGLKPNPRADRRTLIRRAYFDLIGLPPSPEEVEAFINDKSPKAWEKVIERLLASPHYGERWGRHWLDLARFAESHGYEQDYDRPNAYTYRDFVIKALNQDMPYNQFARWQLAGDEFAPNNPLALMATGFLGAGTHATQITKSQVEKERYDELDDMAATTGVTFLGLTIGCARCHDHKFDPISQQDYYRLVSTFTKTVRSDYDIDLDPEGYKKERDAFDRDHAPLADALVESETEYLARCAESGMEAAEIWETLTDIPDAEWQARWKAVREHRAKEPKPNLQKAMICSEGVPAIRTHTQGGDYLEETHFLRRGDPNSKGEAATQSFLTVLMRTPDKEKRWQEKPPEGWRTPYQRRALANWITDVEKGAGALLARVIVNRIWQHEMGRGIVATPSDFGTQGERPTHPELLDYLATELIRKGWKLKAIHRMILTSATYQQSAAVNPVNQKRDPENKLCWRHPRRRLEAEVIRDSMLAVSGLLDAKMFGPGTLDESMKRRSIYFFIKRSRLIPTMMLFDAPDSLQSIGARQATIIAPQALLLLNNRNVREWASALARRVAPNTDTSPETAITEAYRLTLGRRPEKEELSAALAFLRQETSSYQTAGQTEARTMALTDFCQALFGLNEFIYVD